MKTDVDNKDFARRLALKERLRGTWKLAYYVHATKRLPDQK